jgi:hypothetical protein
MAHLLDLPTEIRLHIFTYVFDTELFIITSPHVDTKLPARYWWRLCACRNVVQPLNSTGNLNVDPSCDCSDPVDDGHDAATRMSLLSVSKQVHSEAKDVVKNHVYKFNHRADFDTLLLASIPGRARTSSLTTLVVTICPCTLETHVWNLALRQLYLPHGTMNSPDPHFPSLKALQLRVRGKVSPGPGSGSSGWDCIIWIFAFRYLAIEELQDVSVDATDYIEVSPIEEGDVKVIGPSDVQRKRYEDEVQEYLRGEYMPGEQDDIELHWNAYCRKLGELGMVEDLDAP